MGLSQKDQYKSLSAIQTPLKSKSSLQTKNMSWSQKHIDKSNLVFFLVFFYEFKCVLICKSRSRAHTNIDRHSLFIVSAALQLSACEPLFHFLSRRGAWDYHETDRSRSRSGLHIVYKFKRFLQTQKCVLGVKIRIYKSKFFFRNSNVCL